MKKVNIILCTYNGEAYLRVLLDSLLAQTYRNITIYVRDDNSQDGTKEILSEYCSRGQDGISICVLEDKLGNLGYVNNFVHTIQASGEADYYAFCDQDDYWAPQKIERAVAAMDGYSPSKCLLYSCAYEVRNCELEYIGDGHRPTPWEQMDVGKALSLYDGGYLLGFTIVINRTLRDKAFGVEVSDIYSHDIWVQAVAIGFGGEMLYDETVSVYFRRHENATSIAESEDHTSWAQEWKYRWNAFWGNEAIFGKLKKSVQLYGERYAEQIARERDLRFLQTFAGLDGKRHTLGKLLYPHRLKKSWLVEIAWRLAILSGKI